MMLIFILQLIFLRSFFLPLHRLILRRLHHDHADGRLVPVVLPSHPPLSYVLDTIIEHVFDSGDRYDFPVFVEHDQEGELAHLKLLQNMLNQDGMLRQVNANAISKLAQLLKAALVILMDVSRHYEQVQEVAVRH